VVSVMVNPEAPQKAREGLLEARTNHLGIHGPKRILRGLEAVLEQRVSDTVPSTKHSNKGGKTT
jgi:hypothetical protein